MKWLPCRVFVALSVWAFAASTPPPAFSQTPAFAQTKDIGVLPARVRKEMARGERYALLIGIGRHQDKRIPGLNYSAADAKAMYAVLTDPNHGRFPKKNVRLLLDERATAKGIRRGFTWLRRRAGPEDMAVVYYSGHGAPEEGGTYWVPYDADIDDLEATAVGNAYITRQLRRVRAKRLITFLDSCYSAAIVKKEDRPKALFNQDFFAKFKGAGRVTITASDGKELSLESKDLGQGVFTYYPCPGPQGQSRRESGRRGRARGGLGACPQARDRRGHPARKPPASAAHHKKPLGGVPRKPEPERPAPVPQAAGPPSRPPSKAARLRVRVRGGPEGPRRRGRQPAPSGRPGPGRRQARPPVLPCREGRCPAGESEASGSAPRSKAAPEREEARKGRVGGDGGPLHRQRASGRADLHRRPGHGEKDPGPSGRHPFRESQGPVAEGQLHGGPPL